MSQIFIRVISMISGYPDCSSGGSERNQFRS